MTLEIREISSKRDLRTFVEYPQTLYRGNKYYVPSLFFDEINILSPDKNPAFASARARYWLAYRDGRIVGRIAGIHVSKHEQKWGERLLRFGWIDFEDDPEVVAALLGKVEEWARQEGFSAVHGPLGFTDLDREGMLVEGFEEVATLATLYNFPYYPKRLEELGYVKDVDWVENEITLTDRSMDKVEKTAQIVASRNELHMFNGKKRDLLKIAPQIFGVVNEAYRHLYGTTPLSAEQIKFYVDQYFGLAMLDFIPVVLDKNDQVVAFGISFPSFSKALQKSKGKLFPFGFFHFLRSMRSNDRVDLYLEGIRDEYLGKGVNGMLMNSLYKTFISRGIRVVESNPTLETNNHVQVQWKYYDCRQHKRRRIYIKHLSE